MATIRDIEAACTFGEVATVEAWLDSGHHPDEGPTNSGWSPERVLFLLRRGAKYDQRNHRGEDAETIAAHGHEITQFVLADVRAAGGIKKYLREPIVQLNCLRLLCQRGRATAPSGVLATLMGPKLPRGLTIGPSIEYGDGICRPGTIIGILMRHLTRLSWANMHKYKYTTINRAPASRGAARPP